MKALRGASSPVHARPDQAHLIEDAAGIALLLGADSAHAHARPERLQPALDARLQPVMNPKRGPHRIVPIQQARRASNLPME